MRVLTGSALAQRQRWQSRSNLDDRRPYVELASAASVLCLQTLITKRVLNTKYSIKLESFGAVLGSGGCLDRHANTLQFELVR